MMTQAKQTPQQLWDCALRILSRRDHSRLELSQKLRQREFERDLIEQALDKLEQQQWLSDSRFAAVQVRQHIFKKHGPLRIRMELRRKGVHEADIEQALAEEDVDWFELALACYQSRFRDRDLSDIKEKARRMRYLQSRGFNSDQIRYALESPAE